MAHYIIWPLVFLFVYSLGFKFIGSLFNGLKDRRLQTKLANLPRGDAKAKDIEAQIALGSKRQQFNAKIQAAMHDRRLLPVQEDVIGPLYEQELDAKGKPKRNEMGGFVLKMDENDKPIPKLDDKGQQMQGVQYDGQGKKIKRYKFEKRDPKYGIVIDPGNAPTWVKLYKLLFAGAVVVSTIGAYAGLWILIAVGTIIAIVNFGLILKNGKACMESTKAIYEKVLTVVQSKIGGSTTSVQDPHEIINITDWEYEGEARDVANATTEAAENGESEKVQNELPRKNKAGVLMRWPIATFRDQPAAMTIQFPATFSDTSESAFLEALNLQVGARTVEWVAKKDTFDAKTGKAKTIDGWDYKNNEVTLRTMPPLPDRANLPDDLDATPWNTIRLGRTVDGEAVWDLSGEGFYKGDKLHHGHGAGVTTPMALVPLSIETEVWVAIPDDEDEVDGVSDVSSTTVEAVEIEESASVTIKSDSTGDKTESDTDMTITKNSSEE